jgi:hypothetical protein
MTMSAKGTSRAKTGSALHRTVDFDRNGKQMDRDFVLNSQRVNPGSKIENR